MAALPKLDNLKVETITDREILHILNDVSDEEGYASSEDVLDRVRLATDNPMNSVGSRLGFMRKMGCVTREHRPRQVEGRVRIVQLWKLTDRGKMFMNGKLNMREQGVIETLTEEKIVDLTMYLTMAAQRASGLGQHLVRRQLRHGLHPSRMRSR